MIGKVFPFRKVSFRREWKAKRSETAALQRDGNESPGMTAPFAQSDPKGRTLLSEMASFPRMAPRRQIEPECPAAG